MGRDTVEVACDFARVGRTLLSVAFDFDFDCDGGMPTSRCFCETWEFQLKPLTPTVGK
jgi:hypothetical protein